MSSIGDLAAVRLRSEPIVRCDYRIVRPDAAVRRVRESVRVMPARSGVPQRYSGSIADVTDCKRAEADAALLRKLSIAPAGERVHRHALTPRRSLGPGRRGPNARLQPSLALHRAGLGHVPQAKRGHSLRARSWSDGARLEHARIDVGEGLVPQCLGRFKLTESSKAQDSLDALATWSAFYHDEDGSQIHLRIQQFASPERAHYGMLNDDSRSISG